MKRAIQEFKNICQKVLIKFLLNKYLKQIKPGGIAIDCGANVGEITCRLAKTGAQVYAFEPNPYAFAKLTERVRNFKNVVCYNSGVWDKNTTVPLYFHQEAKHDDEFWSFGSSIVQEKINIDKSHFVNVELIDLIEFIEGLKKPVDFLKMDIEGAEIEVLEKFIAKGMYQVVAITLVEEHSNKIKGQKEKIQKIRRLIKENKIKNIKLSWA